MQPWLVLAFLPLSLAHAMAVTPPLPQGPCRKNRVIAITDSHGMGPFYQRLEDWLLTLPDTQVYSHNLGGSSPAWFIPSGRKHDGVRASSWAYQYDSCGKAPRVHRSLMQPGGGVKPMNLRPLVIDEILGSAPREAFEREIVIIEEGYNMYEMKPEWRHQRIAEMLAPIRARPGTRCYWVGPPNGVDPRSTRLEEVYRDLRLGIDLAGGDCLLIDSRPLSVFPRVARVDGCKACDKVHYPFTPAGVEAGNRWADGVIERITATEAAEGEAGATGWIR